MQNILHPYQSQVPLKSVAIGNGLVSLSDTMFGTWETLCTTNPGVEKPVFNETRCEILATNIPRCLEVSRTCDTRPDPAICAAAFSVCWEGVVGYYDGESGKGGRNRYDSNNTFLFSLSPIISYHILTRSQERPRLILSLVTAPCEIDRFCYRRTDMIEKYLNLESSLNAIGVPSDVHNYSVASAEVSTAFALTSDIGISTMPELHYLLTNQIDVLIYQGNLDLACNTAGAKRWTSNFQWKGQAEFNSKELKPWKSTADGKETKAGLFKEVNIKMVEGDEKRTRFAFITIDGSGHMVCRVEDICSQHCHD